MGGSDQWGNIVTGTELIRRKLGESAYAFTAPLLKKSDGGKFGKTESGNIWLDKEKTSPYKFYQFWLNTADSDAKKYIKIFTFLPQNEIEDLIQTHDEAPHLRALQKKLAEELTVWVHSSEDLESAQKATEILFGKSTSEDLLKLNENELLEIMEGVPQSFVEKNKLNDGINIVELLAQCNVFPSNGEARKMIQNGGVSLNKEKIASAQEIINASFLINEKYILIQKGKKNYYLIIAQ
ncbi:MAG: tyrosine--tRNA ligase, partial [Chitinophagaceae bacterium]|nr:tyrosine--tRNA ligase [Chitinophagaceae bacterium]